MVGHPLKLSLIYLIFAACKRSLGQDNIFTSICHSVHDWDLPNPPPPPPADVDPPLNADPHDAELPPPPMQNTPDADPPPQDTWYTTGYGQQAGGTHPTGMLSC